MIKVLSFFKRNPRLTHEEFRNYYETKHSKLFEKYLAMPGIERYFRRYLTPVSDSITGEVRDTGFDVVMEVWLSDPSWYDNFDQDFRDFIAEDEEILFDRKNMYFHMVEEFETDILAIRAQYAA